MRRFWVIGARLGRSSVLMAGFFLRATVTESSDSPRTTVEFDRHRITRFYLLNPCRGQGWRGWVTNGHPSTPGRGLLRSTLLSSEREMRSLVRGSLVFPSLDTITLQIDCAILAQCGLLLARAPQQEPLVVSPVYLPVPNVVSF